MTLKRDRLEAAGCAAHWCIDPDVLELTAWHLENGGFVETAHVVADEVFETSRPFPIAFRPRDLNPA